MHNSVHVNLNDILLKEKQGMLMQNSILEDEKGISGGDFSSASSSHTISSTYEQTKSIIDFSQTP